MAGYGGGGYGGGGYGGGGYGGGGYAGPSSPNWGSSAPAPAPQTPSPSASGGQTMTPAQQINQLTSEIGRLQSQNPSPNSPTYGYLQGLQAQLAELTRSQQASAPTSPSGFARPGVQPPMQMDSNRSLIDQAQNGAARPIGEMRGIGASQTQAANVAAGRTPTGQQIEAPTIEGPSQKSLYSFVPSAAQANPGLDSQYLNFLQSVFQQNRLNPAMNGAGGTPTAGLGTGKVSGVRA